MFLLLITLFFIIPNSVKSLEFGKKNQNKFES